MKRLVYFSFFLLLAAMLIMPCCKTKTAHGNFPENFDKMARQEQVKWCAGCHKDVYDNEMKGPHAASFTKLMEHSAFINSPKYECAFYTKQVNGKLERDCMRCHAVADLFQTAFTGHADSSEALTQRLLGMDNPLPTARPVSQSRLTGVDCISCHYDGQGVITAGPVSTDTAACYARGSAFAKSNMTCFPCHFQEVKSLQPATASCINCHQEYKEGKGTHYYYWLHDAPGKTNPLLVNMVNDLTLKVNANGNSTITWKNTALPHVIGICTETIMKCEVLNKDSQVLGNRAIRLNRKRIFDKMNYEELGKNNLYGVEGDTVPFNNTPIVYDLKVSNPGSAKMLRVAVIQKGQYWFPDSLGAVTLTKVINLPNTK